MFFSSSSSSSSSASPPAVVLFARILCVRIRLFLLPPLKHTLRAEEEEEEEEEYDVDAVFDDFATREARCKVVCFVVIFASSYTTFRMPLALLFIHIVILFRFRADKNEETFCLKAKESSLCALCLSLLGPKRRERVVRFCYKNERRKALLLLELSYNKAYNKEEQHTRERDLCFFEENKGGRKIG